MMLEQLAVPPGPDAVDLLPRLRSALAGGAPIAPYAATGPCPPLPPYAESDLPDDLAVVVGTSGSTGTPKRALLSTRALTASTSATHARLGGPGQWLLTLPAHHIAGLQVLLRSLIAGTSPVFLDHKAPGFSTSAFIEAAERLDPGQRHYTSLVPTQLLSLLDEPRAHAALRAFDAILVGGAALPLAMRRRADAADVAVVATYGMSETSGGCVYDGITLPCTHLAFDDEERIYLGGATIADGYLGRPDLTEAAFGTDEDGRRWFRTDDVGRLGEDSQLRVDGRVDDLIITGGLKVAPRMVEEAIALHVHGVREVVVVGAQDPHWGQAVSALIVLDPAGVVRTLAASDVRAALRGILPDYALPQRVRTTDRIPQRGPGKPDRRTIITAFSMGE